MKHSSLINRDPSLLPSFLVVSIGAILFIFGMLILSPHHYYTTSAVNSEELKAGPNPSLTLSLSEDLASITGVKPAGAAKTASLNITTATDNPSGYTTSFNADDTIGTCLKRPSDGANCSQATHVLSSVSGSNTTLGNNQWGATLATSFVNTDNGKDSVWFAIPSSASPTTIDSSAESTLISSPKTLTFGAKVNHLTPAAAAPNSYQNSLTITAVPNPYTALPPTIDSISPGAALVEGGSQITIQGTNLETAYQVFIDLDGNGQQDEGEACESASIYGTDQITCLVPPAEIGDYNVVVETWGGTATLPAGLSYILPFTITLDPNTAHGGVGEVQTRTMFPGQSLETIDQLGFSYDATNFDYFIGWSTDPASKIAQYSDGQTIDLTTDTTLYALWKGKPHTIYFEPPPSEAVVEGEDYGPKTVYYDEAIGDLPDLAIFDYGGGARVYYWYLPGQSGISNWVIETAVYLETGDLTLHASYVTAACLSTDTPIILIDGTSKLIDELQPGDEILAWDFAKGVPVASPISFIMYNGGQTMPLLAVHFGNDVTLEIFDEEALFDLTLNRYVIINRDSVADYVGHTFRTITFDAATNLPMASQTTLLDYEFESKEVRVFEMLTAFTYNFFADGVMVGATYLELNSYFDWAAGGLTYDYDKIAADYDLDYTASELAGLHASGDLADILATKGYAYSYEELAGLLATKHNFALSRLEFEVFNGAFLKISVAKGLTSEEALLDLIVTYLGDEDHQIIHE